MELEKFSEKISPQVYVGEEICEKYGCNEADVTTGNAKESNSLENERLIR